MPWKLKKFDLAWSGIWRTGFTFVTIAQLVANIVSGPGNSISISLIIIYAGGGAEIQHFADIAGRHALAWTTCWTAKIPQWWDNNVNSPSFLTFFGMDHLILASGVRFLGKK